MVIGTWRGGRKRRGNCPFFSRVGHIKDSAVDSFAGKFAGKRRRDVIGGDTVTLVKLAFGGILHIPMGILVFGVDHPRANP
jgi:hypothetical protein